MKLPFRLLGCIPFLMVLIQSVPLAAASTVVAWGSGLYGLTNTPAGLTGAVAVAAGSQHVVALKNDGTVVTWGFNGFGQRNEPAGLTGLIAISAGHDHTVALRTNGTVVAWGRNDYGQASVPVGLSGVTAVAAAFWGYHTLALKNDGPRKFFSVN